MAERYGLSVMEGLVDAQRVLNKMAADDPIGYAKAVAAAVAERIESETYDRIRDSVRCVLERTTVEVENGRAVRLTVPVAKMRDGIEYVTVEVE